MQDTPRHQFSSAPVTMGGGGSNMSVAVAIILGVFLGAASWFLLGRMGMFTVMALLMVTVVGTVLSYFSWRNMVFLIAVWFFSMSGFRTYAMIYMPVLPDVSLERILIIWIMALYSLRLMMGKDHLRGPYVIDSVILAHTVYVLLNVMYIGERSYLHEWTISSVSPFLGFLIGKNLLNREREQKLFFVFIFVIVVYYSIQSIAQKYGASVLIWPKEILTRPSGFWQEGRSRGPFLHPPLFGQIIAMMMMVQYYFFFRVKNPLGRSLILLAIIGSGLALLFTYTRAPWVAAAAGVLTLAILRPRFRRLIVAIGIICAVAAFVGLLSIINSDFLQDRISNNLTFENRLAAMSAAVRMWRDHPLFGIGYFNWDLIYPQYHRGEYIPFYGYVSKHAGIGVEIHDIFWGRMAEEGVVSMGLLAAIAAMTFMRIRYLWNRVADTAFINRDALAVFMGIFVTYLVGGMGIDYRYFDLVNVIPYLLIGVLFGYRPPELPPPPPRYPLWTPPYYAQQEE